MRVQKTRHRYQLRKGMNIFPEHFCVEYGFFSCIKKDITAHTKQKAKRLTKRGARCSHYK